jgi:hypothetical protein
LFFLQGLLQDRVQTKRSNNVQRHDEEPNQKGAVKVKKKRGITHRSFPGRDNTFSKKIRGGAKAGQRWRKEEETKFG